MNDGKELKKKESKIIRAQKLLYKILQYFIYFQICISDPNKKKSVLYSQKIFFNVNLFSFCNIISTLQIIFQDNFSFSIFVINMICKSIKIVFLILQMKTKDFLKLNRKEFFKKLSFNLNKYSIYYSIINRSFFH